MQSGRNGLKMLLVSFENKIGRECCCPIFNFNLKILKTVSFGTNMKKIKHTHTPHQQTHTPSHTHTDTHTHTQAYGVGLIVCQRIHSPICPRISLLIKSPFGKFPSDRLKIYLRGPKPVPYALMPDRFNCTYVSFSFLSSPIVVKKLTLTLVTQQIPKAHYSEH